MSYHKADALPVAMTARLRLRFLKVDLPIRPRSAASCKHISQQKETHKSIRRQARFRRSSWLTQLQASFYTLSTSKSDSQDSPTMVVAVAETSSTSRWTLQADATSRHHRDAVEAMTLCGGTWGDAACTTVACPLQQWNGKHD